MAVVRLDLNNVCRHAAFYDLEGVKWVRNGYEQVPRNWNLVTGRDVTKCDGM